VLLLLDTQHYGFFIAQIFFGLWLVPLGISPTNQGGSPRRWASCSSSGRLLPRGYARGVPDPSSGQTINTFITIRQQSWKSA